MQVRKCHLGPMISYLFATVTHTRHWLTRHKHRCDKELRYESRTCAERHCVMINPLLCCAVVLSFLITATDSAESPVTMWMWMKMIKLSSRGQQCVNPSHEYPVRLRVYWNVMEMTANRNVRRTPIYWRMLLENDLTTYLLRFKNKIGPTSAHSWEPLRS